MKKLITAIFILGYSLSGKSEQIILAGGCFWCMEKPFEKLKGVESVFSGYTDGTTKKPTYKQVSSGKTGHIEAVEINFDPKLVSLETILYVFWQQINPTDAKGQFVDRGHHYTTGIFYKNNQQKKTAQASLDALKKAGVFKKPILTPIKAATTFYKAEEYHQDYYKKKPIPYYYYRNGSGRDKFLDKVWTKEALANWKKAWPHSAK
ncbi:MAG: peptide-methionine (S)-S-oxide reductase MsrA [Bdellovibrionales bacterium]